MPSSPIDTRAKRIRLRPRKNPYWVGVNGGRGGLSLGFRRTVKGAGVWVAKIVLEGQRIEERIGTPDVDDELPGALSFAQAIGKTLDWGRQQAASVEAANVAEALRKIPTVRLAVDDYVDMRKTRANRTGSEGSLKLHVTNDQEFADLQLRSLESQDIQDWRDDLPNRTQGLVKKPYSK